jgi:D-alanyl-D-alanine dipeptidase
LSKAVGADDLDFLGGILIQLANVASKGQTVDATAVNFMISMVKGVEPRDQIEAMLAAQMAAVHSATMTFARRLNHVDNIPQQDSAERAFNKLARTFTAQVEALKRYRSAGEQTVRVEHVTVNEGGQAIVGNVTHGGGAAPKKPEATP